VPYIGVIAYEQEKAIAIFDSSYLISELPETFAYVFPETKDRMTSQLKQIMQEQEDIALEYLEGLDRQDREY